MICNGCAEAADENRLEFDAEQEEGSLEYLQYYLVAHPENCGCACQHRDPEEWDAQYSTEQPAFLSGPFKGMVEFVKHLDGLVK